MNIQELLSFENPCTELLQLYEQTYGHKVEILEKPWWFPFKNAITTTKGKIWWSRNRVYAGYKRALITLAHELQHELDMRNNTAWWYFLYLSPQIWILSGLLGFLGFLWSPLFALFVLLLLAAPWPSLWRTNAECRGYAVSAYVTTKLFRVAYLEDYADCLCAFNSVYYGASWSKDKVLSKLIELLDEKTEIMHLVDEVL